MASTCPKNYSPLPSFEDEVPDLQPQKPWLLVPRKIFLSLIIITSMFSTLALGYILGSWYGQLSRYTSIGIVLNSRDAQIRTEIVCRAQWRPKLLYEI